ncbi:MAG: hypothetical protein IH851_13790 [Armatimonadetes bacterium]|nr:hypothetical protein [Armatimonadota bacterium]
MTPHDSWTLDTLVEAPTLYYYSGMQGWTLQERDRSIQRVERLIEKGATLFAAIRMSREPASGAFMGVMKDRYEVLFEDEARELLLVRLAQPGAAGADVQTGPGPAPDPCSMVVGTNR